MLKEPDNLLPVGPKPSEIEALSIEERYALDAARINAENQANYDSIRARVMSGLASFKQTKVGALTPSSVSLKAPTLVEPPK